MATVKVLRPVVEDLNITWVTLGANEARAVFDYLKFGNTPVTNSPWLGTRKAASRLTITCGSKTMPPAPWHDLVFEHLKSSEGSLPFGRCGWNPEQAGFTRGIVCRT